MYLLCILDFRDRLGAQNYAYMRNLRKQRLVVQWVEVWLFF